MHSSRKQVKPPLASEVLAPKSRDTEVFPTSASSRSSHHAGQAPVECRFIELVRRDRQNEARRQPTRKRSSFPLQRRCAFPAIWAGSKTIRQRGRKGKVSSLPNWTGSDQVRLMELDGDQLTLSLPPAQVNGEIRIRKLTWRRLSWCQQMPKITDNPGHWSFTPP